MQNKCVIQSISVSLLLACSAVFSFSQTADTPIVDQTPSGMKKDDESIIEKCQQLIKEKKLLSFEDVGNQIAAPKYEPVTLATPSSKALTVEEISERARAAHARIGYCYLCPKCDHWHLNLAGGYTIASDVVVTCDHVIKSSTVMREGYLIAVDVRGNVYPVTAIMGRSYSMDTAILRVSGGDFAALPLQDAVKQGAESYCYSSPLGQKGYFSDGIINRFLWTDGYQGGDKKSIEVNRFLRVNISTDWAPGSSGSAVLDECGNAIAHVSQISSLGNRLGASAYVTVHTGVPAFSVRSLVETMNTPEELSKLLAKEEKEPKRMDSSKPDKSKTPEKKK